MKNYSAPISALVLSGLLLSPSAWSLEVTQPPSLTMDPLGGQTPLAGVVEFQTDVPAIATLAISDGVDAVAVHFSEYQTDHYLPVLGLKPGKAYTVEITVTDQSDNSQVLPSLLHALTDPLPANFPNIVVNTSKPDKMEPGFTMMDRTSLYTIIVDNSGDVVWYSNAVGGTVNVKLSNGNVSYPSTYSVLEKDLLGSTYPTLFLDPVVEPNHHDLYRAANGNILALMRETVIIDNFPTSETDPNAPTQTATVEDNPVAIWDSGGSLLNLWRLSDIIDPTRIGYNVLGGPPRPRLDWAHANSVWHDSRDDSIIVSVRHQNAVVKISATTGSVKWILANHNNWAPEYQGYLLQPIGAPFEWQFAQHAAMVTPTGTLLVHDNGNDRRSPFDGIPASPQSEQYSRAVEYDIDENTMEVRQVWEYGGQIAERIFSRSRGDADVLPETGNILITFSDVLYIGGIPGDDLGYGTNHTRIIEVSHDTPAEKVFDLSMFKPGGRVIVYRSDRIHSLYADNVLIGGPMIDIKPSGNDQPNDIDLASGGKIPIAIITTDLFDASMVDPSTLLFGPSGAAIAHKKGHLKDYDRDGDIDLIAHFSTAGAGIACGDTEASVTGQTYGGTVFSASGTIRSVCK